MQRYIVRRVFYSLISLWLLTVLIFLLVRITPGPAQMFAERGPSRGSLQSIRVAWGVDKPLPVQYYRFMSWIVRGGFSQSTFWGVPSLEIYSKWLPNSLLLIFAAALIAIVIGVPLGIMSAVRPDSWWDSIGKMVSMLGMSMPNFWVGLILIMVFAVYLHWLPVAGLGGIRYLIMPAFTAGWFLSATLLRMVRSGMIDVLSSDYIRLARLKGLAEESVILKHAFKNALIPVLTMFGMSLVMMMNSLVIIEIVFAWPGVGRLLFDGMRLRDYPMVLMVMMIGGAMIIFANLVVDILYAYIDPRIRNSI